LFEGWSSARKRKYGIHDPLATDLCIEYIGILLQILCKDREKLDWDLDVASPRIAKAESLLEEIIGAYFSEEAKGLLMPQHIVPDIWPGGKRMRSPGGGQSKVQILEDIARFCGKQPFLGNVVKFAIILDDICLSYRVKRVVEKVVNYLVNLGRGTGEMGLG
jgi:hypothetical protein